MIWPAFLGLMAAETAPLEARCEVARSYIAGKIEGENAGALVFGTGPVFVPTVEAPWQWYVVREAGDPVRVPGPSDALWDDFAAQGPQNAVKACLAVRALLDAKGVEYGEAAVSRATGNGRRSRWRARVVDLTLPVLSADGIEAITVESSSCGPLCGGGMAYHLRPDSAGKWRSVALTGLYVS